MTHELTSREYWEATYSGIPLVRPIDPSGFRNRAAREIAGKVEPHVARSARVLEIGGGGSRWLAYLSGKYPHIEFSALDYSRHGIDLLNAFLEKEGVGNLSVYEGDLFTSHGVAGTYDFVYSPGVVEHFEGLQEVLIAKSGYLNEEGHMFTLIPNMRGLNGWLTRLLNRRVYDIHVPHDLEAFRRFHRQAGLRILESGYLCASNFGILSSYVEANRSWKWSFYKALTRLGKMLWYMEDKFGDLPRTALFSPYLYAVSVRSEGQEKGDGG